MFRGLASVLAVVMMTFVLGCSAQQSAPRAPAPAPVAPDSGPPVVSTPLPMIICGAHACPAPPSPYKVSIKTQPTPMAVNQPTLLVVDVTEPSGTPAHGLNVSLFAAHAEDIHQDVGPTPAGEAQLGTYQAEMTLHERGDYTITATIDGPLGRGQHVFNIDTAL